MLKLPSCLLPDCKRALSDHLKSTAATPLLLGLSCRVSPDEAPLPSLAASTALGPRAGAQELLLSSHTCPWTPHERHCWPWPAVWLLGLTPELPHCYGCVWSHQTAFDPGGWQWMCPALLSSALWGLPGAHCPASPLIPNSPALAVPRCRRRESKPVAGSGWWEEHKGDWQGLAISLELEHSCLTISKVGRWKEEQAKKARSVSMKTNAICKLDTVFLPPKQPASWKAC